MSNPEICFIRFIHVPTLPAYVPRDLRRRLTEVKKFPATNLNEGSGRTCFFSGVEVDGRGGFELKIPDINLTLVEEGKRNLAGWYRALYPEGVETVVVAASQVELVPEEELSPNFPDRHRSSNSPTIT